MDRERMTRVVLMQFASIRSAPLNRANRLTWKITWHCVNKGVSLSESACIIHMSFIYSVNIKLMQSRTAFLLSSHHSFPPSRPPETGVLKRGEKKSLYYSHILGTRFKDSSLQPQIPRLWVHLCQLFQAFKACLSLLTLSSELRSGQWQASPVVILVKLPFFSLTSDPLGNNRWPPLRNVGHI